MKFSIPISQTGNQRVRSDTPGFIIDVGGGLRLETAPHGIDVEFVCKYPMEVSITSDAFDVNDVDMTGSTTGLGAFDFGITLNDGVGVPAIILGRELKVDVTWNLQTLESAMFYLSECVVIHGATRVQIVQDGCYATALKVSLQLFRIFFQNFQLFTQFFLNFHVYF